MKEPRYRIELFWSDEDDCWIANVPDLWPCSAFGGTRAEAISEACTAIDLWLETAIDGRLEIPQPQQTPSDGKRL